jgi:hypothetical protein
MTDESFYTVAERSIEIPFSGALVSPLDVRQRSIPVAKFNIGVQSCYSHFVVTCPVDCLETSCSLLRLRCVGFVTCHFQHHGRLEYQLVSASNHQSGLFLDDGTVRLAYAIGSCWMSSERLVTLCR